MKLVYDTNQSILYPYPRRDNEPLVGSLSPGLVVLEVIEVQETIQDPYTEALETFQEIDVESGTLTRGQRVRALTSEEIAVIRRARYKDAEVYQVREWMLRNGADPDTIVYTAIDAAYTDPLENSIQRDRWNYISRVPRDHPLVDVVGSVIGLTPTQIDSAWASILAT